MVEVLRKFIEDSKTIRKELKPGIDLLNSWDYSGELNNRAAALGYLTFRHVGFNPEKYTYDYDKIVEKLDAAIEFLTTNYDRIDVPLGEVQRLRHGTANLPLAGGPDMLRAIYTKNDENIMKAVAGDCYVQFVEWDENGNVHAESIHQFGASTSVESSTHYDDQAELFSKEIMKLIRP